MEKYLEAAPEDGFAHLKLAEVFFRSGRFEDAIDSFQKASQLPGDKSRAFSQLGATYFNLGQYSEASEALEQAVELDSKKLTLFSIWGVSCWIEGISFGLARTSRRSWRWTVITRTPDITPLWRISTGGNSTTPPGSGAQFGVYQLAHP